MRRQGARLLGLLVLILTVVVGYQWLQREIAVGVYRDRLKAMGHRYERMRQDYNEAVTRTAVTELVVDRGRLSVVVRTLAGVRQTIQTPFDPNDEVFVDYVVIDGRLLVRRVFDAKTPPSQAMVLDRLLGHVDWDAPNAACGKAVYRRLSQGRWVVTVTGDGSLGLAKRPDHDAGSLTFSPSVKDYPQVQSEIKHQVDQIGLRDVLGKLIGPGG